MKSIKVAFFAVLLMLFGVARYGSAQSFHLVKATSQRWAGGVAGHFGVNYYIELETSSPAIIPDTVWVDGRTYPINFTSKRGNEIRTVDSVTHKITYSIWARESHIQVNPMMKGAENDTATGKPARNFEGVALVSYELKHKQHFFTVKSFTQLPQLNYP